MLGHIIILHATKHIYYHIPLQVNTRYLQADISLANEIISRNELIDSWQHFHDRMDITLDSTPEGYYCIFREAAPLLVPLIRSNIPVSEKTIPDISMGQHWGRHWEESELSGVHGDRIRYEHNYPEYYPQAASNPQPAWAYPESSLPDFRKWLRATYLPEKLPKYLDGQVKGKKITKQLAIEVKKAIIPKQIESD